jgi:hypothetical protein
MFTLYYKKPNTQIYTITSDQSLVDVEHEGERVVVSRDRTGTLGVEEYA